MQMIFTLLILQFCVSFANNHQTHLGQLKEKFPHGLLTDAFGILSKQDLQSNTCIAGPVPFSKEGKPVPYPYWQCFEVKKSRMFCEPGKYDSHEKAIMSILVLSEVRDDELHEFISRRPISLKSCRLYQKDWQKFTKNENYVCISGSEGDKEIKDTKTVWTWIFGRYKTKKGCDSYFLGHCNSTKMCKADIAL
jgi:hypothetical protein